MPALASDYLKLLRTSHWLKNAMLLFPPVLSGVILQPGVWAQGIIPLTAFCFASSATYIFNDIMDRDSDRFHPRKKVRAIAAGRISIKSAVIACLVLTVLALALGSKVSGMFFLLLLLYLGIFTAYSLLLKDIPIIDLFCISSGFILRLYAGGEAFGVIISEWLFLSVFLLSIFLSTGKRLGERKSLGEEAAGHRKSLGSYPDGFLDGTMFMTGAAVLVTYTIYVITTNTLVLTVPLCCFGLLRFMFRVQSGGSGDPTESLLNDMPLFVTGILWAIMIFIGIYL